MCSSSQTVPRHRKDNLLEAQLQDQIDEDFTDDRGELLQGEQRQAGRQCKQQPEQAEHSEQPFKRESEQSEQRQPNEDDE